MSPDPLRYARMDSARSHPRRALLGSADVYSFAIVMWEMVTRKVPYAGHNFMNVTLDVHEGRRPPVPGDCPGEYEQIMSSCWQAKPKKRPTMADVLKFLNEAIGSSPEDELA